MFRSSALVASLFLFACSSSPLESSADAQGAGSTNGQSSSGGGSVSGGSSSGAGGATGSSGSGGTSSGSGSTGSGGAGSSSGGGGAGGGSSSGGGSGTGSSSSSSSGGGSTGTGSSGGSSTTPTLITEPEQGLTPLYDLISSATKSIDMTMYELTDTTVTGLLTKAAKAGITVRVILYQNLEKSSNTTAYDALSSGNVQVHWANATYAATHQKTITIDRATSAIMTLNLTPDDYSTSRDFAIITTDAADVAAIEATFGDDFTNASVTPPTGDDLVWSPTNSQSSMVDLINGAKTSLAVENEEMSDTAIVSALGSAAARGVSVQVIMTASSSWDSDFTTLEGKGVKVVTYAANASLYIHAKIILADYGQSGAAVFLGSENFSSASLTENRELGLITSNAAILDSLHTTLASDFAGGTPY